jgi:uncharacterized repeat protein (TIGR02543 family)
MAAGRPNRIRRFLAQGVAFLAIVTGLVTTSETVDRVAASISLASTPTFDMYLSPPRVQGTFVSGVRLETFDTIPTAATTSAVLAVGTISAGSLSVWPTANHGGAVTTSSTPIAVGGTGTQYGAPTNTGSKSVTIDLVEPVDYFGFYWTAGSNSDGIELYSGETLMAQFVTGDIIRVIPKGLGFTVSAIGGGSVTNNDYYVNPKSAITAGPNDNEPFAYVHIVATGTSFDRVKLISQMFEFDNLATASLSEPFDPTGLVGVPLNSYAITYNTLGGSSVSPGLYTAGSTVTLAAAPTRDGYEFLGWATTSVGTPLGASYEPSGTGAISLYAQWAPIVTFDVNGATGTNATQSATGNTALRANTFTRSGYTFAGWNTAADGSGDSYANGASFNFTAPTTLYAQWTLTPPPPPVETSTTTTPTTTVAPTTTIPAAIIAPVLNNAGELPTLLPGDSMVTDNGNPVPVEVFFDNANTLVMRGQDFELNLAGQCDGGCDLTTDSTGRQVLQVQQDGNALVNGYGFLPRTLVHIWMFSEPTYLGALTVADDGTFAGSVYLEGIAPGAHTLQVNGTSFDGNERSANLGVIVAANTGPLPATGGGNTAPLLALAALTMVMLGALARRRA